MEAYQIIKDIMEDHGIPCKIVRNITWDRDDGMLHYGKEMYFLVDLKHEKVLHLYTTCAVGSDCCKEWYYDTNPEGVNLDRDPFE